ncbi:zinc-binding dehydrogenase [Streptomyces sp. DH24]|uniref:zinc-binding dehydrogenase n=1 Tax=Streptomyces sp. DH24 TaxID=3040123 RepID=UPI0024429479|nr:zinc-binding dehydrogenase [Streptomyces sp. DH24]MDG9719034.1 zinc-binding dehydrogenase [Streptomyces sp. DH24]
MRSGSRRRAGRCRRRRRPRRFLHCIKRTPQLDALARHVEAGRVTLRIAHVLPFEEGPRAHALLEKGGTRGKILLVPGG